MGSQRRVAKRIERPATQVVPDPRPISPRPQVAQPLGQDISEEPQGRYEGVIDALVDGVSVFVHGPEGIIAHILRLVPKDPISGVMFVAVLVGVMFAIGIRHDNEKTQSFCLHCILVVGTLGVGMIVVCYKYVDGGRLSELHNDRDTAIHTKSLYPPEHGSSATSKNPSGQQR